MQLENSDLLNVIQQISTSNRNFIQLLLNHGCISYNQFCSDILKVVHESYHTSSASRKFYTDFNSFISCYLQFVFCVNKKLNFVAKQHVDVLNIRNFFAAMSSELFQKSSCKNTFDSALAPVEEPKFISYFEKLKNFINSNSLSIDFDHLTLVLNSKLFGVCSSLKSINNENALKMNEIIESKQISAVDDFLTFLSPLKDDYTKSSKGYICQTKSIIVDINKHTSNFESLAVDISSLNLTDESEIEESSITDDDNYDPVFDGIVSKQFSSSKNLSSDSEISLNGRISNSDSDDSITYSYYVGKCMYSYGSKPLKCNIAQCCDILSSESDSEDGEIFDNSLGNKFFKVLSSNISDFSELSDFNLNETFSDDSLEICDENSSPVYQSLEESLMKNFSNELNSLSQSNAQTYSTYFDGFINPCFENDEDVVLENIFLRNVNEEWERNMQNIPSEPREPKKVSFRLMPNLVTVQTFEPDDDDYSFGRYLFNQVRFRNRIEEFEQIIKPFLSTKHRASIYKNYFSNY